MNRQSYITSSYHKMPYIENWICFIISPRRSICEPYSERTDLEYISLALLDGFTLEEMGLIKR